MQFISSDWIEKKMTYKNNWWNEQTNKQTKKKIRRFGNRNKNTRMFTITCLNAPKRTPKLTTTDSSSFELFICQLFFTRCVYILIFFLVSEIWRARVCVCVRVCLCTSKLIYVCVCARESHLKKNWFEFEFEFDFDFDFDCTYLFFDEKNCESKNRNKVCGSSNERLNCMRYTQQHMKTDVDRYIDCCHPTN